MLDSRDNLPPPRFNTEIFSQEQADQPPLPRKPSKWKKIGGLFKAKHVLAMPMSMNEPKVPPKQAAHKQKSEPRNKPPQRRGSTEEWPMIEVDASAAPAGTNSSPQRSRKLSLPGRKANKPQLPEKGEKGRLLEIDIPDVQMERYSVMFSQVMNRNQRPSLLARRSKTLDNLRVPNNQVRSHLLYLRFVECYAAEWNEHDDNDVYRTFLLQNYPQFLSVEPHHQHDPVLLYSQLPSRQKRHKFSAHRTSLVAPVRS
jgi:hypothetical protein